MEFPQLSNDLAIYVVLVVLIGECLLIIKYSCLLKLLIVEFLKLAWNILVAKIVLVTKIVLVAKIVLV